MLLLLMLNAASCTLVFHLQTRLPALLASRTGKDIVSLNGREMLRVMRTAIIEQDQLSLRIVDYAAIELPLYLRQVGIMHGALAEGYTQLPLEVLRALFETHETVRTYREGIASQLRRTLVAHELLAQVGKITGIDITEGAGKMVENELLDDERFKAVIGNFSGQTCLNFTLGFLNVPLAVIEHTFPCLADVQRRLSKRFHAQVQKWPLRRKLKSAQAAFAAFKQSLAVTAETELQAAKSKLLVAEDHLRAVNEQVTLQKPYYLTTEITASSVTSMVTHMTWYKRGGSLSIELNNCLDSLRSDSLLPLRMKKLWKAVEAKRADVQAMDDTKIAFQRGIANVSKHQTRIEAVLIRDKYAKNERLVKRSVACKKMYAAKLYDFLKEIEAVCK